MVTINITFLYYIGILLFSVVVSVAGYYLVGIIFGEAYNDTRNVIAPLVFAAAFNGMYKMHTNYVFFTKKTYIIMSITLTMGLINIIIVYYLVKSFGIVGAA